MKTLKSETVITESLRSIDKLFKGSLIIEANNTLKWQLYFRLGRLSWVTGGTNYSERLQRHLAISCPNITRKQLEQISSEHQLDREQKLLVSLQGQGLISRNQMASLMENIAVEVLFDAIQQGEINSDGISCKKNPQEESNNLLLLLPFLDIEVVLTKVKEEWEQWQNAGLADYFPNLYPVVKDSNLLKNPDLQASGWQIIDCIDGTKTLRDIAASAKKNVIEVANLCRSLVKLGAISFSQVPVNKVKNAGAEPNIKASLDSTSNQNKAVDNNANNIRYSRKSRSKKLPLIVCVDDSPLICKAVENIVSQKDYRFLDIQEPIKVIPLLLRNKPDLIFLDLMMPIINGYELCSQLRKTPSLKEVPIIILTGKDGLIDRMRAKLVGSTDFLAKPVEPFYLLKMLEKYLQTESINQK